MLRANFQWVFLFTMSYKLLIWLLKIHVKNIKIQLCLNEKTVSCSTVRFKKNRYIKPIGHVQT
jgi:hypothetical protein